ncbi:hypothetical protein HQN89_08965 [Paenibacillus frigoriresistens]|nr:hypothetical protein [Paenibacillus frigoriresistens]
MDDRLKNLAADKSFPSDAIVTIPKAQVSEKGHFSSILMNQRVTRDECTID